MPPAPVIGQGGGVERPTKVLRQLDAEHLGHAAGDIDATGEVAVELDTVEEDSRHNDRAGVIIVVGQHRIHQDGGPLGDDQLLKIAPHGQLNSVFNLVPVEPVGAVSCGPRSRNR